LEHYHLQALAAEVDACIHTICAASEKISPLRAAIMAAYLFADEAKREQGKHRPKPGPRASDEPKEILSARRLRSWHASSSKSQRTYNMALGVSC
jgi:cell division protein ZapA (FtsZ GTPase activity inhibitor)